MNARDFRHGLPAVLLLLVSGCSSGPARGKDATSSDGGTITFDDASGPDGASSCPPGTVRNLDDPGCNACLPKEAKAILETIWANRRAFLTSLFEGVAKGNAAALYDAQGFTNNLLKAAAMCSHLSWIDELSTYILSPFEYLTTTSGGYRTWLDSAGREHNTLSVSQFLYLVSEAIQIITALAPGDRTSAMRTLLSKAPIVLLEHYRRWILDEPRFETRGWGCNGGGPLIPRDALTLAVHFKTKDAAGVLLLNAGTTAVLQLEGGALAGRLVTDAPNTTTGKDYTAYELKGTSAANDGKWHHGALVFSTATQTLALYLDGVQVAKTAAKGKLAATTGQLFLGGYDYGTGSCCFLAGTLDEARLYKTALSGAAIATLSTCGAGAGCPATGLVSRWPLDAAYTARDSAGGSDLTTIRGALGATGVAGGALTFDGVDDVAFTHNWFANQTHRDFLRGKRLGLFKDQPSDPDYCHGVMDTDMWIITGLVEILAARARDQSIAVLTAGEEAALLSYLGEAVDLLQSRLTPTALTDLRGGAAVGLVHDRGIFDGHPDFAYAGYTGATFPTEAQKKSAAGLGWDISHNRRLVHVFETLHRFRSITRRTFPEAADIAKLANQFAYGAFNKDLTLPLFSNFSDGTNGWFRVNYNGRTGFGYAPFDLSSSAVTGGYGFWAAYNEDIDLINRALWKMVTSTDPKVVAHRAAHYNTFWNNHQRTGSLSTDLTSSIDLLYFLPTFAVRR